MENQPAIVPAARPEKIMCGAVDPAKLLQSIVDVVCAIDKEGVFRYVSLSSLQLFGYTAAEMTGASFLQFIHPDDVAHTVTIIAERTHNCQTSNFRNRYFRKDGSLVPLIWSGRWDENDQLVYCAARDGTEELELETRLSKAQQLARVANYEFDVVHQCYTYTSDTIFDIFGIDRKKQPQFTTELFWTLVHPDDQALVRKNILHPEHIKSDSLEYRIVRPDGCVVYIHRIREVFRDANGQPVKTIGTLQDVTDRRIGELAVQQSEERLRWLVENGNDIIGIIDAQGNYNFVGSSVQAQLGYPPAAFIGRNAFEFIHPDDAAWVAARLQELSAKQRATVGPFRFRNSEGAWRWIETTVTNHIHNPAIGGLVVNSRDITEKKQQEDERQLFQQRIREQNETMLEMLEQMQDGFATFDVYGTVLYWNKGAEEITGLSRDDVLGKNFRDLFPNFRNSAFYDAYTGLLANGYPIEDRLFSPLLQKWIELRAYRTRSGISVFFRDVTQHRQAQAELQKLSLIAKETVNAVALVELNEEISWVNEAFTKITGYSFGEVVGRKISELLIGPDTDLVMRKKMLRHFHDGLPFRGEIAGYTKLQKKIWLETCGQPLFDNAGNVERFFIMHTDISERKRLEKELEGHRQKTTAAVIAAQERERSQVGRELHDNVNQVLTSVKLYQELIVAKMGNQQELACKSSQLLQESIDEIRSLSKRLSAPSLGNIRLKDSVNELVETVAATNKFRIQLDVTVIEEMEAAEELHLAVYRILQEHLTNVLKYADAHAVNVVFDLVEGYLVLEVTDDGKGFDTKQKRSGIGITNMIMRAESLRGTLSLHSAPGAGCVLTARFPLLCRESERV